MATKKNSTIKTIVVKVADVASAVIHAADDQVIHPVGEALGIIKKPEPKGKSAKKAERKEKLQAAVSQKSSAKASTKVSAKARMMSKPVPASRVTAKSGNKPGPGPKAKGR